jgi:hypothetical protein
LKWSNQPLGLLTILYLWRLLLKNKKPQVTRETGHVSLHTSTPERPVPTPRTYRRVSAGGTPLASPHCVVYGLAIVRQSVQIYDLPVVLTSTVVSSRVVSTYYSVSKYIASL